MSKIFNLLSIIIFFLLLIEAIVYPGSTEKYLKINPYTFLSLFILLAFICSFWKKITISKYIEKINNKYILPGIIIIFLVSLYVENITYRNFTFSHFHIHYIILADLIALCLSLFYLSKTPKNKTQKLFYLIPPIILTIITLLNKNYGHLLTAFVMEDGLAEYCQFVFYLIASYYFYKSITKTKGLNKKILIIFCLTFILVAGEEISWGQRIFNLKTPETLTHINKQEEISIHNLAFIHTYLLHQSYMLVGFLGAFLRPILKKFFPKFKLITFTPKSYLRFGFLFTLIYYLLSNLNLAYDITSRSIVPGHKWQELAETFLSISIMGYSISLFQKFKTSSPHRKIIKT